jgi:hypothetical protein
VVAAKIEILGSVYGKALKKSKPWQHLSEYQKPTSSHLAKTVLFISKAILPGHGSLPFGF